MVSADHAGQILGHPRGYADVVWRFGILGQNDIARFQRKAGDFRGSCCGVHQVHITRDAVVLVDVGVIAQANRCFVVVRMLVHPAEAYVRDVLDEGYFPMLWHLAQPFDAGWFQRDRRVEAACDGVVDDAQLLFGEQLDEIAFGLDEAGDVRVLRAEVGDDLVLLGARGLDQRIVE